MTDDTDHNPLNDAYLNAEIKRLDADLERMVAELPALEREIERMVADEWPKLERELEEIFSRPKS